MYILFSIIHSKRVWSFREFTHSRNELPGAMCLRSSRSDHEEDGPRWPAGPEDRRGLLQVLIPLRQALTNDSSPAELPQGSFLHWGVDILHEAAYNKGRTIRCLSTRIKNENPRGSDPLGFSIPNYVPCNFTRTEGLSRPRLLPGHFFSSSSNHVQMK